jgi:hypothetical protein
MAAPLPPRITHEPNLVLSEAPRADLPGICDDFYVGFTDEVMARMFPDTPGLRKWWEQTNGNDMANRASDHFLVMRDMAAHGRIVAYAKWQCATSDVPSAENFSPR